MDKNIIRICLAAALPAVMWSCSEKIDNSAFSDMLGEDYNQQILWNVDSLAFRRADWTVTDASYGAELHRAQIEMFGSVQSISYMTYESSMFFTKIASSGESLRNASEIATDSKAVFAINGGPFDASGATSFVMADGKVISQGTSGTNGAAIAISETLDGSTVSILPEASAAELQGSYTSAMIAGPALVTDGKELTFADTEENTARKARTIFGTDDKGDCIMAVIDGGVTGRADGATMAEAAFIARIMGLQDALCLSGGDASAMWLDTEGVVSHPSGNGSYDSAGETPVANIIYVEINTPFAGGDGTQNDPYQIATPKHIQNMASVLKAGTAVYFELIDDIDMTGIDWVPLNYADPYTNIVYLDGNGHTIHNFFSSYASYPSFFGVLYGECRDIRFLNARIDGGDTSSSGGIIGGYIGTSGKPGLVENTYVQGSVYAVNQTANGGIAGQINTGTVRNCYADVTVETKDEYMFANYGIGGIVGDMRNNATVENCFVTGKILGKYNYNAGGVAGRSNDGTNVILRNNISWVTEVNGRVAVGSVTGRWQTKTGTAENNYSNASADVTTYANDGTGEEIGNYGAGSTTDYADFGTTTAEPCRAASELGWDTSIWDLTGKTPQLKLFLDAGTE